MAATVEGLFKIIDGASAPMKRMERQAKQTDKAIEKLGKRLDTVGSDKQLKQMDQVDRQIRSIDRDASTFSGGSGGGGRLRKTLQGAGDDSDRLSVKLGRVGISLASIGKIFQAMKLPLMVAGVVALVQGVSALAGGLVSLLPKLTDVAGVAGALPATFLGIGIAAASTKIALAGLGPALKGTKGAMAALTPRAREFVRVLKELKPLGQSLRSSAQAGLFPGLTNALGALKGGAPTAKRLLKRGGATVGGVAERAAEQFTQGGFLKDFESIGNQGLAVVNRLGSGLLNIVQALRHVAVAAEPFTEWLSKTVLGWTEFWKETAIAGRRTGELRAYFDRTRAALETFGSILSNLWTTFKGIGAAARPLGEDLWQSADKATERWARFTNSLSGRQELRDYFDSLGESLHAIFEFTGELGKAFINLGSSGGFTSTAKALTDALQPLEHLFETIGERYGPVLAHTVEQLVRLFDNLGGGSFAILNLVEGLNLLLEGINALLEKIPGLSNLIVGILGAVALNSLGGRLRGIAADWGLIATNAGRAAVAQRTAATGGGIAGGVGGVAGRAGRGGVMVGGFGLPKVLGGRGLGVSTTYQQARAVGYSRSASAAAQGGALAMGAGRGLMAGAGAAARFLGPAALIIGGLGALTRKGDFTERLSAGISQGTFGILPEIPTHDEVAEKGLANAQSGTHKLLKRVPQNRTGLREAKFVINQNRKRLVNEDNPIAPAVLPYYAQVVDQLNAQIVGRSKSAGAKAAEDFGKAWSIRIKNEGASKAGGAMLAPLLDKMTKLGPQGARILAQANLHWYKQAAKDNPKLAGLYKSAAQAIETQFSLMGEHIRVINGQIFTGSKSEWKGIADAIGGQAERAKEEASAAFTQLQQQAVGSLIAMGYNRTQAVNIIKGMEKGGAAGRAATSDAASGPNGSGMRKSVSESNFNKAHGYSHARGGRIGGFGNQDRTPLGGGHWGANEELIVNKHTEADANTILGRFGMSLGGMVNKEGRPHSELVYARGGRRPMPGGGAGIESVGKYASGMGLSVSGGPGFGGVPSSGHVGDSLHYSGLAYDVSGAPAAMTQFRRAAEARYLGHGLNELFYDPYSYYIDAGTKHPGALGGHSDHVHIGFFPGGPNGAGAVRGLMGGAGAFKALKAQRSKLGGVPGALANAAMGAMTAGMNKKLAAKAGLGAVAARGGVPKGGVRAWLAQALRITGHYTPANLEALYGRAMQESGGDPNAINNSDSNAAAGHPSQGLLQTIPETFAAYKEPGLRGGIRNPVANAAAAINYMFARYGHIVGPSGSGYSRGGRIPGFAGWFGQGGDVEASKPTLLGIGDGAGTEVASVRPKFRGRAGGRGGGGIHIGSMKIENHRPGDVRRQVTKEVNQALNEVAAELDLGLDTDDEEVLA